MIYAARSASDEMHILLTGELSVVNEEGIRLARLYPITTVGEMGLVTRHTRSASVQAGKPSDLLVLHRRAFDLLLKKDPDLQTRFYQNVISILAGKIVGDNVRVRDHLIEKVEHQRDLRFERRRTETILQLLVEHSDLSEEEAKTLVDERLIPGRMRVLIVDDEPAIRALVTQALVVNYDVDEAEDGTEAMKAVETTPPDLVITDIRMPHMDGTALLKGLRNIAPNLPILALSGYVDPEDVAEYGFDGFVKKPFELDDFRVIVDQTTGKAAV
jgi:CheY-like chemotaxis protein